MIGRGPGSKRFRSKTEALAFLRDFRNEPAACPFRVPEADMAWLVPLLHRHPCAPRLLRDWDGRSAWVEPMEVHGRECRVFRVETPAGLQTISGHECIRSEVTNEQALSRLRRVVAARREAGFAAFGPAPVPDQSQRLVDSLRQLTLHRRGGGRGRRTSEQDAGMRGDRER